MKPKPQPHALDALVAPGHLFFCRRVEVPAELAVDEVAEFVYLELENLSPFPLEHMYYGYCLDRAKRHAFVYASYRRRFEAGDTANWLKRDAALPDFMVALSDAARDAKPLVLVTPESICGFVYDDHSSMPVDFIAEARLPVEDEEIARDVDAEVAWFVERWRDRLKSSAPRIWLARYDALWLGPNALFAGYDSAEEQVAQSSFTRDEIWQADLRDPDTLDKAKKIARQNQFLWKVVIGVAAAIVLLLFGELYSAGTRFMLGRESDQIASRVDEVRAVEARQSTVRELRSFVESNLVPFQMITEIEPYRGAPEDRNVVYRKFETAGPDALEIEAWATNQTQVTEFKRRLERFNKVVSVELSRQNTDSSGSTFTATVTFKPGAFLSRPQLARNE